jgi:hypothetical protein
MLMLKHASASRPSGEWSDDDYDVLAGGVVVGASCEQPRRPKERRGCGRSPLGIMRTARRRTATSRCARARWRHSREAGRRSERRGQAGLPALMQNESMRCSRKQSEA